MQRDRKPTRKKQTVNKTKWVLLVLNASTAYDPMEVQYCLAEVDTENKILRAEGTIVGMDHGWYRRLIEAGKQPTMEMCPVQKVTTRYAKPITSNASQRVKSNQKKF